MHGHERGRHWGREQGQLDLPHHPRELPARREGAPVLPQSRDFRSFRPKEELWSIEGEDVHKRTGQPCWALTQASAKCEAVDQNVHILDKSGNTSSCPVRPRMQGGHEMGRLKGPSICVKN